MIVPQNKIIIVDNRVDHLEFLSKPFHQNGIGCKTYHYDVMFNEPVSGIRIAFFDINLNDLNPQNNQPQIFSTLANAICTYISNDNEPFALVFWTSNKDLIEDFKAYVEQRKEVLNVPKPFLVTHIDKDEFIGSPNDISMKLSEILKNEAINLLLDFGNQTASAADKTVNSIYKTIPHDDSWGSSNSFDEGFDKVFSKIAQSTLGLKSAKESPTKAVYSALIPMMNYHLTNSELKAWDDNLSNLKNAERSSDLNFPEGFDYRRLNSVFHLEENLSASVDKGTRGVALKFLIRSKSKWCLFITKYFAELDKEAKTYFDLFVQFDTDKSSAEERETFRSNSEFFLLEISAACDYSQNKSRLNKYILGLITPIISYKIAKNKSESILLLPEMELKGTHVQLRLNFNYVFGFDPKDAILGKPLFRLKGEILDQISTLHANHIARIGITSFEQHD
jgi:hypothetical protein